MFSKTFKAALSWGVVASLFAVSTGCSDYIKGQKKDPEVIELSEEKFLCLRQLPDQMKRLSVAEASEQDVNSGFSCLSSALDYFQKRTKGGALNNAYTSEDMRKFFGKYFLKENNVSSDFASELMKVKKAILGGSDSVVTKEEILELIRVLDIVKVEAAKMTPHLKILLLKRDNLSISEWRDVSAAIEQLRESAHILLEKTQLTRSEYTIQDAKKFFTGLADFISGAQSFTPYQSASVWVPLAESVKTVLIGEVARFKGLSDWNLALDNIVDLYGIFLRYHYVVKGLEIKDHASLRQYAQLADQLQNLLANSYQIKTQGQIPFAHFDNLIDQLSMQFEFYEGLTPKVLKESLRTIVLNFLDPARRGESRGFYALTREHVLALRREIKVWRLSQSFADSLSFNETGFVARKQLLAEYAKFDFKTVIEKGLECDPTEQVALSRAWQEMGILLKTSYPVHYDVRGKYIVSRKQADLGFTWMSLMRFNLMKSLARMLVIGYGDKNSLDVATATLKEADLVRWYDDFRTLGIAIKAFDPRSANSGKRSFMEANFFTFGGDGNRTMNYRESFEFISILFSAGLGSVSDMRAGLREANCEISEIDVFGYRMMNEGCFKNDLRRNFSSYFSNLPEMAEYVRRMNGPEWEEFYDNLISSTRVSDPKKAIVEIADIRTMAVVLHYVETVMAIYDRDNSQGLSFDEIKAAAPRFMSFLRTTNPGVSESNLTDGFIYMVIYGEKPSTWDVIGFKITKWFESGDSSRLNIVKVLKALKDDLNKPKN